MSPGNQPNAAFFSFAPGLGYSLSPATRLISIRRLAKWVWDVVRDAPDVGLGSQTGGLTTEGVVHVDKPQPISLGCGYQFSNGNIAGSFPSDGMEWSFDYLDAGSASTVTNWPFFVERGNKSAVMVACDGSYTAPSICGSMNPGHGTSMNPYGIKTIYSEYGGHFRTYPAESYSGTNQNAPRRAGQRILFGCRGHRYEGVSPFNRPVESGRQALYSGDNTMVEPNQ
jgi:hypothetical protein